MSNIPAEYEKAVKSALNMLAYAECTEKSLRDKLRRKNYGNEEIEFAVNYVTESGYLSEERYLERFVYELAAKRLYGKRRIALEIYKKGFDKDKVTEILPDILEKYDFTEICEKAAGKLKKDDREKLFAALLRLGHSTSDASLAAKQYFSGEEQEG